MNGLDPVDVWRWLQPLLAAVPRVAAMFVVAPLLMRHTLPSLVRNAVVVSLSLSLYPFMSAHMPSPTPTLPEWLALVAKEVLVGGLIGYAVGAMVWVMEGVGALIDVQSGLANAMLFDPFGGHPSGVFGAFMAMFGMVLFIGCGGLYAMLSLLFDSYRLWPPGSLQPQLGVPLQQHGLGDMSSVLDLMVRLALPAVLVLLAVEMGLGLVSRIAPQLNVFFFSVPIKCVVAALMLALCMGYLLDFTRGQVDFIEHAAQRIGHAIGLR